MTLGYQVVDISANPVEERRRRRRAWLRVGVPVAGVVVMIATILVIAVYSERTNRQGVLALSDDLLSALDSRIALQVSAYLDPAARAVRILRGMMKESAVIRPSMAQANGATVLREIPQVSNVSFADQDGNYILIRRLARRRIAGGTEMKIIDNTPGARSVTWIYQDAAGTEIGRRTDPKDDYDPRTRPWYQSVADSNDLFWTGAYVFYTDRTPGITVSGRYKDRNGRIYVYGVDIALDDLSHFLASMEIGQHGRAVIVDDAGNMVASPEGKVMVEQVAGDPVPANIYQLNDPALSRAYDLFWTDGPGRYIIDLSGNHYIVTATPLVTAGRNWLVLIAVREQEFVGFVASGNRRALEMSLAIVFVAAVLAILLVRQGLHTDRSARLLRERQNAVARQSAAFAKIATDVSLFDPTQNVPPRALTETLAETTAGRRAAIWRISAGGRTLMCEDCYDRESGGHVAGLELHRDELPRFLASLQKGEELRLPDAEHDRQGAEFHRACMEPYHTRALLAVPVRREDQTVGAVTVEDVPADPMHQAHALEFVRALASMLALRLTVQPAPPPREPSVPEPDKAEATALRSFSADLRTEKLDPATVDATLYPDVAVMVLRFTDPAAMAQRMPGRAGAEGRSLTHEVVSRAQRMAEERGIPYLKLAGHDLLAAAGFTKSSNHGVALIADTALAIRDCCVALFEESDQSLAFRIGIDCGLAMGCILGTGPGVFNLWGDVVSTAEAMATSAMPGSVQVTEALYQRLRRDFLFRPRGRFYLPRIGEAQTFTLASRT